MFNFNKIKSLETRVRQLQLEQIKNQVSRLTNIYPTWDTYKEIQAYKTIDDVYSIVTFLSETAAMVPLFAYKVVKEDSFKKYKRTSGIVKKHHQIKALDDLSEDNKTARLLKSLSFERMVAIYLSLFLNGETILFKRKVDIGPRTGEIDLIQVNPLYMTAIITEKYPQMIVGWKYSKDGDIFEVSAVDVIHIKLSNPDANSWRGLSPVKALSKRLNRINASLDISVAQMQNGGLPGIIYEKDLTAKNIGKRKEDFANYLQKEGNTGAPYWMDGEIGYIQTGTALADLQLAELSDIDFKKLCNAYRMPSQLLNNDDGAKYDNMEEAEKRLYTNTILPNVIRVRDSLNDGLFLAERGEYIDYDISDIPAMQDDVKKQAETLSLMWWVTPNEKRAVMKYDAVDNPMMDEIIIDSGKQLLNDLEYIPGNEPTDDYSGARLPNDGEDDS